MNKIVIACLLSLLSGYSLTAPELKGTPQELRGFLYPSDKIVTIHGDADATAYSDKAVISLVISTENKQLSQALNNNSSLRTTITASLISAGIASESINSSKFSSSPEYGWFGDKPSSYKVINRMAISITNESHLHDIATIADQHEEIELADTTFEHTKKDEFNNKVKEQALAKIIKQKNFYEKSLGLKLIPIAIRDANIFQRATPGALTLEKAVVTRVMKHGKNSLPSDSGYHETARTPSFDEVIYSANFSVDFKVQ